MIKTTYYCDLCKEERPKEQLYQFYFDCGRMPQQYVLLETMPSRECHKHICKQCVEIINNHN